MIEIFDDITTAQAILLLAEHIEHVPEPERSFIEAIMEGVVEGAQEEGGEIQILLQSGKNEKTSK